MAGEIVVTNGARPAVLAYGFATVAPGANSTTTYADMGIATANAVAAQPVDTWLHFFIAGLQGGSTNAITVRLCTVDGVTTWFEETVLMGVAFAAVPFNAYKPIPAGTAVPILKAQYKSGTGGQNAAVVTPTASAPATNSHVGHILIERRV